MKSPILRYFDTSHLTRPDLLEVSQKFEKLAHELEDLLPAGPEKTTALRKLLESKDCAVRTTAIDKEA